MLQKIGGFIIGFIIIVLFFLQSPIVNDIFKFVFFMHQTFEDSPEMFFAIIVGVTMMLGGFFFWVKRR